MPSTRLIFIWFAAVLLSLVLVCSALGLTLVFVSNAVLLDPINAKTAVHSLGLYPAFSQLTENMIADQIPAEYSVFLGADFSRDFVAYALPSSWFDGQVDRLVDSVFGFVTGSSESLELSVSLVEPKQKILPFIESRLDSQAGDVPLDLVDLSQLPDSVSLDELNGQEMIETPLLSVKEGVRQIPLLLEVLGGILLVCIGLIALLFRNQTALLVIGADLLMVGFVVFGLSLAVGPMISDNVADFSNTGLFSQYPLNWSAAVSVYSTGFTLQFQTIGLLFGVCGIVLLAGWGFLKTKKKASVTAVVPA